MVMKDVVSEVWKGGEGVASEVVYGRLKVVRDGRYVFVLVLHGDHDEASGWQGRLERLMDRHDINDVQFVVLEPT